MSDVKKVGILLRVSTGMQVNRDNRDDQDEFDLPMQRKECLQCIAKHPDWVLEKEYLEVGSGFKNAMADRDKINEIIADIEEKTIDILLVFMFDRLARTEDEAPAVVKGLVMMGAEVWSVREGQMKYDKHIDGLLNYITFWQAAGESKKTSERVTAAMKLMAEEGKYTGGKPPYGYVAVETGKITKKRLPEKRLEINEEEARIIRLMYDLTITHGYGCHRIAMHLNESGIRTKSGKQWISSTIATIMKNPIYKGVKAYNRTTTKIYGRKKGQWRTSPDTWVMAEPNPELAIVSEVVWNQAQSIKAEKLAIQSEQQEKNNQFIQKKSWARLLFVGYIYCGCCGSAMNTGYTTYNWVTEDGVRHQGNKPLYRCCAKASGKLGCESKTSYSQEVVEGVVLEEVNRYLDTLKNIELTGEIKKLQKENVAFEENMVKSLKKEIAASQRKIGAFEEEIYKSIVGESPYSKEKLNGLIDKETAIFDETKAKLDKAETALDQKKIEHADLMRLQQIIPIWSQEFESAGDDQKKVLLSKIIEKVVVYPDRIEVKLRMLIEDFLKGSKKLEPTGSNGSDGENNYIYSYGRPNRHRQGGELPYPTGYHVGRGQYF